MAALAALALGPLAPRAEAAPLRLPVELPVHVPVESVPHTAIEPAPPVLHEPAPPRFVPPLAPAQAPSPPVGGAPRPRGAGAVGFLVSSDGILLAPHLLVSGCRAVDAVVRGSHQRADVVVTDGDVAILRVVGGPFTALPPSPRASRASQPVTLLGADAARWRVAAGDLLPAGANRDDAGWPQMRFAPGLVVASGPVWAADGGVVGIGIAGAAGPAYGGLLRVIPAGTLQRMLQGHGIAWNPPLGQPPLDADAAMRRALAAAVPLSCA